MIKLIIFDFDGTLFDTKYDIARSVNIYLKELGFRELPEEKIFKFIGNGSDYLLKRSLEELGEKDFNKYNIERFLEIYNEEATKSVKPFDGIECVLKVLKDKFKIYIVTNKDENSAKIILKKFGFEKYFNKVIGRDTYNLKKPDAKLMEIIIREENLRPHEVLVIGDSEIDFQFAKNLNTKVAIVLWGGIGEKEELKKLNADYILYEPIEILNIFKY
ncbi:MAG: HAD family hydrolase [Caldisericia bacterium]|jgi:phosphoglycolate phosphatase|nr:HAD family hydrolase [Caldisericia bacterium]